MSLNLEFFMSIIVSIAGWAFFHGKLVNRVSGLEKKDVDMQKILDRIQEDQKNLRNVILAREDKMREQMQVEFSKIDLKLDNLNNLIINHVND